jgi:shikimate dehydrogenase
MHNASLRALDRDAVYLAFDVAPGRLDAVLPAMRDMGFGGVNLTVPLKEVGLQCMDELDASAGLVGAVNTVEFTDTGAMRGHNTDGAGFLLALQEAFGAHVEGRSVFMLGCGGAGRGVAITCAREGAASLCLTDIDTARAQRLRKEIESVAAGVAVRTVPPDEAAAACPDADLVVQATPVGMKPTDPPLLKADAFREGQCVFDLVYMYPETAFMAEAGKAGAEAANGLGMLLHQGAHAYRIWTGEEPDVAAMREALESAVYGGK